MQNNLEYEMTRREWVLLQNAPIKISFVQIIVAVTVARDTVYNFFAGVESIRSLVESTRQGDIPGRSRSSRHIDGHSDLPLEQLDGDISCSLRRVPQDTPTHYDNNQYFICTQVHTFLES